MTAFIASMQGSELSATLALDGEMTIAEQTFPITGDGAIAGDDSRFLMRIDLPNGRQESEQVELGGQTWKRSSRGPWLEEESSAGDDEVRDLTTLLASVLSVEDEGVVTRDGRELHRLVPSDEIDIAREAFGITDPSVQDFVGTLEFLVESDGTLVVMTMGMAWSQASGDTTVDADMTVDFEFSGVGDPVTIEEPDDVWTRYESSALGYRIAHPTGWEVTTEDGVEYFGAADEGPLVWVGTNELPAGTTLEAWAAQVADADQATLGVAPASSTRIAVAGGAAQALFYQGGKLNGESVVAFDVLVPHGSTGYSIGWLSAPGNEQADGATLDALLATFAFVE